MSRRFFIGVVPEGLEQNSPLKVLLGKMKRTLRERGCEARWATAALWHVTLVFLGDLSDADLARAVAALEAWRPRASTVELELAGLGAFPAPHEARVIWLGVQRTQELVAFRQDILNLIQGAGLTIAEDEGREFVPHLTLARLRNLQSVDDLVRLGGRKRVGTYPIREVILFESVLQGNMKKYVPIARKGI